MGTVGQPDDKGILQPDDKITGDSLSPETSEPPPPSVQKAMDAVIEVTSGSSESFQGTVDTSALPRGTKAPPPPSPVGIKKTNPPTNTDEVLKANIEGDRNAFAFFISKKSVGEESKLIWVGNQDDMTTIMSQDDAKSKEIELAKKEGRYILGHGQTNITVGGSPEARAIIADLQAKFDADPDRQLFETYDDLSPDLSDRLNQNMNRFTSILRNPEVPGLELNEMTEGQSTMFNEAWSGITTPLSKKKTEDKKEKKEVKSEGQYAVRGPQKTDETRASDRKTETNYRERRWTRGFTPTTFAVGSSSPTLLADQQAKKDEKREIKLGNQRRQDQIKREKQNDQVG